MKIETYFENHKFVIENELRKAKKSVYIAVAWINFKEYFDVFNKILSNSATLKIICSDNWQNRSHQKEIDTLIKNGAEIRLLKMPRQTNHMHHKFAIIDNKTILNGSFNWSPNAQKSFENILVLKNFKTTVTEFISEFEKLYQIESESIKILQKTKKCSNRGCDGEVFNILVFSESPTKYYEIYGDIIEVCSCCEEYTTIEHCVSHTQLHMMLNAYNESFDDIETELIDRDINNLLNNYVSNNIIINAVGRVRTGIKYPDDDFVETNIIWKNKFVGNRLQDKFDTDFDVVYDN